MTLEPQIIQVVVARILAVVRPVRIILFGSYARGDAAADSDIDLLVVVRDAPSRLALAAEIRESIGDIGYGVDVLVATEQMMTEYGDIPGIVYEEAQAEGIPVYVG